MPRSAEWVQQEELPFAMSKAPPHLRTPRQLAADDLARHGRQLMQLADEFERLTTDLRARPDNTLLLPEMRRAMSQAGRTLLLLLHHRAIDPPTSLPPWLSWRTRSMPRPRFCKSYLPPFHSHWSPARGVRQLVQVLVAGPEAVDAAAPRHLDENTYPRFVHRHVFIEAVAGWLGQRARPGTRVVVPTHAVVLGKELPELVADEDRISVVFDWCESLPQQRLLLLDLGPACAAACRFLADQLRHSVEPLGQRTNTVDWAALRSELLNTGDPEGAEALDALLASPRRNGPTRWAFPDGEVCEFEQLTDAAILDAMSSRRQLHELKRQLRPSLEADATTTAGLCAKWQQLAAWVPRFSMFRNGRDVLNFGIVDGRPGPATVSQMYPPAPGEEESLEMTWLGAFREATRSLVPVALDAKLDDVAVHHLLKDLDDAYEGEEVHLSGHVRAVEVIVRAIAARTEHTSEIDAESSAPLDVFEALDDLFTSASQGTSEVGLATHAALFGEDGLYGKLAALASRRSEFKRTFTGPVRDIADFAVTSGHEALAFFAERVAGYAKVRRDTIPRIQAETDSARRHGRSLVAEQKQAALMLAGEDFAKALVSAFSGWNKERAWIQRSIEDEFRPPSHERVMEPVATPVDDPASRVVCADLPRNGFVRMGDYWDVTFENVRKSIRHSKGMGYVGQLLAKPNMPIHSWTLAHGTEPPEAETAEATDDKAIDAIRQEIKDLTAFLEEATDVIQREAAEVKLKELKAYVASNSKPRKKRRIPRKERDQLDQTRETVGKAIQNAIRTIARHVPALGEHLRAHIDSPTGITPCYRSAEPSLSPWMLGG